MNEDIRQDFIRFLRHEAMFRNVSQSEILVVVIKIVKDYEIH